MLLFSTDLCQLQLTATSSTSTALDSTGVTTANATNYILSRNYNYCHALGVIVTPADRKLRSHAHSRLRSHFSRLVEKFEPLQP